MKELTLLEATEIQNAITLDSAFDAGDKLILFCKDKDNQAFKVIVPTKVHNQTWADISEILVRNLVTFWKEDDYYYMGKLVLDTSGELYWIVFKTELMEV